MLIKLFVSDNWGRGRPFLLGSLTMPILAPETAKDRLYSWLCGLGLMFPELNATLDEQPTLEAAVRHFNKLQNKYRSERKHYDLFSLQIIKGKGGR